ncbi:MAG: hypothetical protein AAB484_01605 [Patescibacteria group bacterium]
MKNIPMNFEELKRKVAEAKKSGIDLSTEEDLSIAVMNLLSLEEHFFFTGAKTEKSEYYDLLNETREIRKVLLARMIEKTEGESWCISKHLLATVMRLMEVGTKLQADGKKESAQETFGFAYKIYNIFFALRLKIIKTSDVANMVKAEKPMSFDDIMSGLINCCKE